ncbi:MAG: prephenate dehydrogenase/arogenate dehydrogenase family protein [Cyanobacteria bacterium RUI128]|nr:prephenate dehydrogenase/arogenate dehydrogenase family protein [Cyanobacteria bacterium RUI128]
MTKIGVVGLGLIGGSIFKDLVKLGYEVTGVSKSQAGKVANVVDNYSSLADCELVFVCKEMSNTLAVLDELENYLSPQTVVCDVCSLKEFVSKKEYKYHFIPTHPMAGTEFSGWDAAKEGLFKGAKWVITSDKQSDLLEKVIKETGAEIIKTTPKEHDEAVALISHMPMVIAQALYKSVENNDLARKLASSGFRDMTRLALSSIDMACDMVSMNSENIEKSILKLYSAVGELTHGEYRDEIEEIKSSRAEMYKDGVNVL